LPPLDQVAIRLVIRRGGADVFDGFDHAGRDGPASFADLVPGWDATTSFPDGVILLTGPALSHRSFHPSTTVMRCASPSPGLVS